MMDQGFLLSSVCRETLVFASTYEAIIFQYEEKQADYNLIT